MTFEEIVKIIDKEFGVSSHCSQIGSCKEDVINEHIIEVATKNKFPEDIIKLFKNNPYEMTSYQKFDNGLNSGRYFISLVKNHQM